MSTSVIDQQQIEIERLERELEEARDVPWPDWANTIFKTLKAHGYDPVDDSGEVDLGEAFKDYLAGIAQAEEQERKRVADVFAVHDGGNSITLHFGEIKSARAFRDTFPASIISAPAPHRHLVTDRSAEKALIKEFETFVQDVAPKLYWKVWQDLGGDPHLSSGVIDGYQHGFGEHVFGPLPIADLIPQMQGLVRSALAALKSKGSADV